MSHQALSVDTEVVLLLCGRFGGERQEPFQPLSAREYGEIAKWLNVRGLRPADLLTEAGKAQLQALHEAKLERKRVEFLLERGTAMALALERWSRGGLWVISRGDAEFPKRLKRHLKHAAPPLLYGAGKKELLDMGGLAIIGSRDASEGALDFTREVAARCAQEGLGVVSGGARGVDAAAMQGSTVSGGFTIGVLAADLLKTSVNRQSRLGLQEGRLVLVSPFYPEAGFSAGNAMGRNKYIYALSDRALVIDSALGSGGTWEGALEALAHRWVPVYVRTPGNGPGNAALVDKGGVAFTFVPGQAESLLDYFERGAASPNKVSEPTSPQQSWLSIDASSDDSAQPSAVAQSGGAAKPVVDTSAKLPERPSDVSDDGATNEGSGPLAPTNTVQLKVDNLAEPAVCVPGGSMPTTLDMYEDFLAKLSLALQGVPLSEDEVAERLVLEKGQAKVWLKKAVEAGQVEKLKKPVRYSRGRQPPLLR
ncbi:DNA-processing protein DprA [Acidovorax sp. K2F]|uniref:DNA-processing protein DprA n=1 Tax=Acidovorax sp. K2F TaxID=2978125 RepID=UPI0021B0EA25|nr:DNA-processing protein DprA [Acidovorax sp. K2F]MCT6721628.1 DNA-processing protein DprA [Acidovorax sp. K2F]